jgi:hypothetical protein
MCFSTDTHPAVGLQVTLDQAAPSGRGPLASPPRTARELADLARADPGQAVSFMLMLADSADVRLIVRGRYGGEPRGFAYRGNGVFQSDRAGNQVSAAALRAGASPGNEQTWTIVPLGSETRMGIDRDSDGILDGDEAGQAQP